MKKPRSTWIVYLNNQVMGETWAVSKAQAINNVRHNTRGDYESQYDNDWDARLK